MEQEQVYLIDFPFGRDKARVGRKQPSAIKAVVDSRRILFSLKTD